MAAGYLVALLAIASSCNGASIVKREAIQGKLDRSLDLLGVHLGIKYKDPADRTKGAEIRVAVDDMKRLFPRAHSSAIDVYANLDGGASNRDGLFDLTIKYKLTHGDGDGDETGSLVASRKKVGGSWVTEIKTQTNPMSFAPILPAALTNLDLKVESDRQTKLSLSYVNPAKGRDLQITATRVPGKEAKIVVVKNGVTAYELNFTAKDLDLKKVDGNFEVQVQGTAGGAAIEGSVKGEANSKGNRIKIEFEKGNNKFVQIDSKIKKNVPALYFETKTKYSLLGGALKGQLKLKFDKNQLNIENELGGEKLELRVKVIPGQTLELECKKNGEQMWSYKTIRTTVNTAEKFEMDVTTDMTLSSKSAIWAFLDKSYPYGAFNVRKNTLKVFIDRQNRNLLLPKFLVDLKLYKEGAEVVDLTIDTRNNPYNLLFVAPNVFARWNIPYDKIEATLAHDIGKSLAFKTNVAGGIEIDASRGDNAKGGRDIHILTKKAGKQMMKVDISTEKQIDADKILLKLNDVVEIDNDSALYRRLVGNYKFLTAFNKRVGSYEVFVNKKERNVLLSKFYVKGNVVKDGQKVMDLLLTTNEKPYKFTLFLPAILNKLIKKDEYKMTIDHNPGTSLEIAANGNKFTGFKIAKTGNGNEREVTVNGKKLGAGDYTLTDSSFKTKITNQNGDWLEPKITWKGSLPKNKAEAAAFLLDNSINVDATGSKRNFKMDLTWKATKPDWDLSTPENLKLSFNWAGKGPRWGDYSIHRDLTAKVANKVIEFAVKGDASFTKGVFSAGSPIKTDIDLKYLIEGRDLIGKASKTLNGKEYSIEFPEGYMVMPKISMGA